MDDYAFLYTATATGKNSGVHFMMSTEDAQNWCASPKSQGVYCGNPWAYFYTTVQNFTTCHWFKNEKVLELRGCCDNGKYDAIIEEMKLKKYSLDEMKTILSRFGIRVNIKLSKI
ncbi:MAG: hypothetical protein Q4D38_14925 [Planctomycetia bacterium]|nr:hypothetical protein [Planctomycetia bacterium]